MLNLIPSLLDLFGKALNWAIPFFLGKSLEKQKVMEESRELEIEAVSERIEVHRDVVSDTDDRVSRNGLREWTKTDN